VAWTFTTTGGAFPLGEGMSIYFGDLHSHSAYSDGRGTPADAYSTARANGLDFYALTDHSSMLTDEEWQDTLDQANAATIDGQFVGLRGFEFTHPKGHINVFDTETHVRENDLAYDTLAEFYAWLSSQPRAIGQFNHPYKIGDRDWNFDDFFYHAAADDKMFLCEVPVFQPDQYLLSLNKGWQVGALGNSDTHEADWGRSRLMGLVAPDLTKDALLEALRARRTFSVYQRNFAVVLQANGAWMGSVLSNTATIHFTIAAYNPDLTDRLRALVLYDNGVPVTRTVPLSNSVWTTWTPSIAGSAGHYYYAKASHGSFPAYTSPVWTDRSEIPRRDAFLPLVIRSWPPA
jgi:hypothetical protein